MILSQPIVLVGMMGCGKTSIGRIIAEKLNLKHFDSDKEIENNLKSWDEMISLKNLRTFYFHFGLDLIIFCFGSVCFLLLVLFYPS